MADTVSQLLRELKPTEQKELLCNRCCWLLSSLRVRLETSQRATVVARGAIPEDLLAKVTGVAMGPCFPGWGPEELFQMCLPGSSASALAGPSEAYASSVGPREAPPSAAAGKSHHSPSMAGFYLRVLQATGGQVSGQPLLLFPLGETVEVTAWPWDDQLLFLCHTGRQKGIGALQTLLLSPLPGMAAASHSPGLWWPASITRPHRASEGRRSSPSLCSAAPWVWLREVTSEHVGEFPPSCPKQKPPN